MFGTLLAFVIRINTANIFGRLDPQKVVIIAMCVLSIHPYPRLHFSLTNVCTYYIRSGLFLLFHRDTDDNPCAYDLDGYDDSEDAVNGNAREEAATGSILGVGIWVS